MAIIEKPQVNITQVLQTTSDIQNQTLPTCIVGERYDLVLYPEDKTKGALSTYGATDIVSKEFGYPGKLASSITDQNYTKLFAEQVDLKYYDSDVEASIWRKSGSKANQLRTLLAANNLVFKTDPQGLYPNSSVFKTRGVKVGDTISVEAGANKVVTTVTGFVADKSTASIGAVSYNAANAATVAGSVSAPVAGGANAGLATLASSGVYTGSLLNNVLEDVYRIKVTQSGQKPTFTVTPQGAYTINVVGNDFYNFSASEIYTIEIMSGGIPTVATYRVTSASGIDNIPTTVTPAFATLVNLSPSRGAQFQFTGAGTFTTGDKYIVQVDPSTARLSITTNSHFDETANKVFPGFSVAFPISSVGISNTFSGTFLTVGDYWDITVVKAISTVTATSGGTFTGPVDINYVIEVVQGGLFGTTVIKVSSTYTDNNILVTVTAAATPVNIGSFGTTITFDANTQGGLIKNDRFSISTIAAKDTAFKTLVTKDSIPGGNITTGALAYTGTNLLPNTGTLSGAYSGLNKALELYSTETYTVSVVLAGVYGAAQIAWVSSSGLDDSSAPVTIPLAPGTNIAVGTQGLYISFTGANPFALTDQWQTTETKTNLKVKLAIRQPSVEIPKKRIENQTLNAWTEDGLIVTVNPAINLLDSSWDLVETLPIENSVLYLHYRALTVQGANSIIRVPSPAELEGLLGKRHKDNPISMGVYFALLNAASRPVYAMYPASANVSGYSTLFAKLELRNVTEVYRIVVQSFDSAIIDLATAHINKMSSPEKNKWRIAYVSRKIPAEIDTAVGTATVLENPGSPGDFDIVRTTDASFAGTSVGDKFEYLGEVYSFVSINTTSEAQIEPGLAGPQSIPAAFRAYHLPTVSETASIMKTIGEGYSNRRVVHVTPDEFTGLNETLPMYIGAAAIAGFKSSLLPHQPISTYEVIGIDEVPKSLQTFTEDNLDEIASGGNLIMAQDSATSKPYIRHQLTTDASNLKLREISITENLDEISYGMYDVLKPFVGKYNLHTGVINQARTNLEGYLFTKTEITSLQAGPQIISFTINRFEQDPNKEDRLIVEVTVQLPPPFNYVKLTIFA